MRKNIQNLINSGITAHQVSLETEVPRNTVYRIFKGEAKLDNVTLKNAEILSEYYNKNKGDIKMTLEQLQEIVKDNVHVSEQNGTYYAITVEENGDEHDLAQANDIELLHEQLKGFQQIK